MKHRHWDEHGDNTETAEHEFTVLQAWHFTVGYATNTDANDFKKVSQHIWGQF